MSYRAASQNPIIGSVVVEPVTVNQKDRIAHAEGRVHVVQDSLEANAGRAIYYDAEHRGLLLDSPRASTGEVTVRGESLEVFTKGKELERMRVHGNGAIDYRGGAGGGQASTLTAGGIASPRREAVRAFTSR